MNAGEYYKDNLGRMFLAVTIFLVIVSISTMLVNLRKASKGEGLAVKIQDLKQKAEPIPRAKYENLITGFKDQYVPLDMHKKNIFTGPSGQKAEPVAVITESKYDFNKLDERLYVVKIYKKPVKLLFKGYMQLGDGAYVATINWGGKTDFKKIGDEIRGYKVVDFKKDISEAKTMWGGTEKVDKSIIILEREGSDRFNLEIGKITLEKEIYADVYDRKELKDYEVYIGSEILGNKVLDISTSQVIISTPNGEKAALNREK